MNPLIAINQPTDAISTSVDTQWQSPASDIDQRDVMQFHDALAFHGDDAVTMNPAIAHGIAALDGQGNKLHEAMSRLHADGSTSTQAMMAMQSEQIQTFVVYEGAARAISLTTQGITELLRMQ